jgi:hypothetical protein
VSWLDNKYCHECNERIGALEESQALVRKFGNHKPDCAEELLRWSGR